ncbi:MAG: molybdopterin-synthase adenylyltransferase MoeB [Planctomycetota bacterium]|jgi:molybdopterin/thiamine biosynthesis adenylyltransferase/rhodanese-related sulfurtransferase
MSGPLGDELLARLREKIPEASAAEAAALTRDGALVVDVRETAEIAAGTPPGAVALPKGYLELHAEQLLPDKEKTLLILCENGYRSLFAAEALARLGYKDVRNLAGGFTAWKTAGLPVARAGGGLSEVERRRYARHLVIPEVGLEGQGRLKEARVLLVGAGGLGSPAAMYLACAGVGTLGIVDFDVVDESNLQRQILHDPSRLGIPKTDSARRTLETLNPLVRVDAFDTRLDSGNADDIVPGFDVVVDGADNFPTRYLLNDACVKHDKPNVSGSVFRFEGQVSVFRPGKGPCYRCLYPEPPPPDLAPSCAEAGVLGILPGVVGVIQAVETVKLILERGEPLYGRLLVYDALAGTFRELKVGRNENCAYCAERDNFPGYIDYEGFCGDR